jgi:transglutaminase-like putative cysteine protease
MKHFLRSSEYIDCDHPSIIRQSQQLTSTLTTDIDKAAACFYFVRDEIEHSWDFQRDPVTCKASEVLQAGTGYCYAKSHLLAALLRAADIPAGLCYQRLTITDKPPFCLHGLNAVHLANIGWYRVDTRGNKTGVNAQFTPPNECLAFPTVTPGEADLPEIWSEPLPIVTKVLERFDHWDQVAQHLPDTPLIDPKAIAL